jgi:hypothetical protein
MVNCLPAPFTSDLKVLVMAGSNSVSERRRRQRVERLRRNEPEVPLENKAFLRLRDRLVIEYLLETLEACGLHRTWILAPEISLRLIPPRYAFRPLVQHPRATLVANLLAAYTEVDPQPNEPVLVLFGDHPLTTAATLRSFLASCGPQIDKADFFHGVALLEAYHEYMPFFRRTCLHLREMSGRASGLNLAVPSRLHRLRLIDEFYDVRKQEQLGALLGLLRLVSSWLGMRAPAALIDTLILSIAKEMEKIGRRGGIRGRLGRALRYALSSLVTQRRIEGHGARVLGAEKGTRLVPVVHGGAGIDVDFFEELQLLEDNWDRLQDIQRAQDERLERHGDRTSRSSR